MKRIVRQVNGRIIVRTRSEKVVAYKRRKEADFITSLMSEIKRTNYSYSY